MRIAILKADDIESVFVPRFGNLEDMMSSMVESSGYRTFEFTAFSVHHGDGPTNLSDYDGYLVTGSRKGVYNEDPWIQRLLEMIRELNAMRIKTVGICFGHQAIAQALGGAVVKSSKGWGVGIHTYDVDTLIRDDSEPREKVALPCCHQDQVVRLPVNARRILSNEFCENAGFTIGDYILAMQPHPEFSAVYLECILRSIEDRLGEQFAGALASLNQNTDNQLIATLIAKFFLASRGVAALSTQSFVSAPDSELIH